MENPVCSQTFSPQAATQTTASLQLGGCRSFSLPALMPHPEKGQGKVPAAALHYHKFNYWKAQCLYTPRNHPRRQQGLPPHLKTENINQGLLLPKCQPSMRSLNIKSKPYSCFYSKGCDMDRALITQIPLQKAEGTSPQISASVPGFASLRTGLLSHFVRFLSMCMSIRTYQPSKNGFSSYHCSPVSQESPLP